MAGAVTKVWDIGGTVFTTASNFKSLIKAVSVENVQPQAVLAAEALGFGIHVREKLLDKAIGVLNGNQHVTWENLKLSIGIHSGDLHKTIRNSTSLLSFFLFACAWKSCFTVDEIGDLAFQMIAHSGIIREHPVSSFQLGAFVQSFSGQCEELNPAGLIHTLAVEINKHSPDGIQLYRRIDMEKLGEILVRLFELLNDESVESITLSGGTGGIWIAVFFSWLIQGKSRISINGKMLPNISIDGEAIDNDTKNSKLYLELINTFGTESYTDSWTIRDWRKGHPTDFVVESEDKNGSDLCKFIPLDLTRVFLSQLYTGQYRMPKACEESAIGELASALVILLSRYGSVYEPEECCKNLDKNCATAQLLDVFPNKWLQETKFILQKYRWPESAVQGQQKALEFLEPAFQEQANQPANCEQVWKKVEKIASQFVMSEYGSDLSEDEDDKQDNISCIIDPAVHVAVNAVATAMCDFRFGIRRIALPSELPYNHAKTFIGSLLSSTGMKVSQFREYSFTQALPGMTFFDSNDIAISSNGYTAGISMLWDFDLQKRNALAIRVCPGVIQRENFHYDSIREVKYDPVSRFQSMELERFRLFQDGNYLDRHPEPKQVYLGVKHRIAEVGRRLELQSYLYGSEGYINPVSWKQSIHGLAIAMHFNETVSLTERQARKLAQRHSVIFNEVYWQSVHEWGHEIFGQKTIIKTFRNEELRFFSCGIVHGERQIYVPSKCLYVVLRHSASLLSSILAVPKISEPWVVIY